MESNNQIGNKDCIFSYYLKKGIFFSFFSSPSSHDVGLFYRIYYNITDLSVARVSYSSKFAQIDAWWALRPHMIMIWWSSTQENDDGSSLLHQCQISFPFIKKQNNHSSYLVHFSSLLFCYPLFISAEIAFVNSFPQSV